MKSAKPFYVLDTLQVWLHATVNMSSFLFASLCIPDVCFSITITATAVIKRFHFLDLRILVCKPEQNT